MCNSTAEAEVDAVGNQQPAKARMVACVEYYTCTVLEPERNSMLCRGPSRRSIVLCCEGKMRNDLHMLASKTSLQQQSFLGSTYMYPVSSETSERVYRRGNRIGFSLPEGCWLKLFVGLT